VNREREAVREACDQLAGYLARLEGLTAEPDSPAGGPAGVQSRPAEAPEPYGPAGRVLMDIWEGIRRLEASLRVAVLGHPGRRRGGSAGNTAAALEAVVKLAASLGDDGYVRAAAHLDRWIGSAKAVRGIDEAKRWRHLPGEAAQRPGEVLPPQCPYCRCFYLLYDPEAGIVVCSVAGCEDGNGDAPIALVGTDDAGRPSLLWNDGKRQTVPDLDLEAAS
jgi:hypothetical protein